MHEIACPACNTAAKYDLRDCLLICQFCSTTFHLELETGQKEIFGDHYIVPNSLDAQTVKGSVTEWLKRMHHKPNSAEKEFAVTNLRGISLPFWIVSLELHTVWKGLVKRHYSPVFKSSLGSDYLMEKGQFRRSFRWAVCARENLCEFWGLTRLHEPTENLVVEWDGFPLDSTLTRGRLEDTEKENNVYDAREFFDYKYANGLSIMGIQVNEEEALRRARHHAELYHYKLAKLNVDYLVDIRTELEIAGIQLMHLPFWHATYQYRPATALRHFYKPRDKNVMIEGHGRGILKAELAIIHRDKVWVNSMVCSAFAVFFLLLGAMWHTSFFIVSAFAFLVSAISAYIAMVRKSKKDLDQQVDHGGLGYAAVQNNGQKRELEAS
jgi:hypothetical protein